MRRKPGTLIPIEIAILSAALALLNRGEEEFHGYQLAREIKTANSDRFRMAAGTLYKALNRMEQSGLLSSRWEDPSSPDVEGRPPRRLYRLTADGEAAYKESTRVATDPSLQAGWQPL
ncbi:MAG TPA: PadR family transcriptional regulator [Dehalococcoidia bacterium]|nr:PadR family transcriptional regulator [Dehalococcoidia bacterium]